MPGRKTGTQPEREGEEHRGGVRDSLSQKAGTPPTRSRTPKTTGRKRAAPAQEKPRKTKDDNPRAPKAPKPAQRDQTTRAPTPKRGPGRQKSKTEEAGRKPTTQTAEGWKQGEGGWDKKVGTLTTCPARRAVEEK